MVERPAPLHSATPYPPIVAYPLSAGLLPEGRQYTPIVPTPTPTSTEGTGYLLPTTTAYSNSNSSYPPTAAVAPITRTHSRSTHRLSAHLLQEAGQEQDLGHLSIDRDLPPRRELAARADRRADDLRSWTSAIIPERKCTTSDRAPLAGSFTGDQAQGAGARPPRSPLHSISSEAAAAAWRHPEGGVQLPPELERWEGCRA